MTTHYIDITVVPDPETPAPQVLGALYDRLHLELVRQRADDIGVSFPDYSVTPRTLGNRLRLHGSESRLRGFLDSGWLKGVKDHVRVTGIAEVPNGAAHRTVQRRQFKTSADRLRRRRMRRKGETPEQAARAIPDTVERRPTLPYARLRSRSTGQPFCLFIALGPLAAEATLGRFNSHGLSAAATIPWF